MKKLRSGVWSQGSTVSQPPEAEASLPVPASFHQPHHAHLRHSDKGRPWEGTPLDEITNQFNKYRVNPMCTGCRSTTREEA